MTIDDSLRLMTCTQLAKLGCCLWEARPDGSGLMLFPASWFDAIPEGFVVRTIMGREIPFERATTSDDVRAGLLAFGIVASLGAPS